MLQNRLRCALALSAGLFMICGLVSPRPASADGKLNNVNHILILMQENHSFDNYLGALPYAKNTPYHNADNRTGAADNGCPADDHACVDGLTCTVDSHQNFTCSNSNPDPGRPVTTVFAFHDPRYCTGPDLDHSWEGAHSELDFEMPNDQGPTAPPNDGFVSQNDKTEQIDRFGGKEVPGADDTMGFYTDADLPFYYALAETFAIDDRYFCPLLGQTIPNRFYEVAGTSFGHLTTSEATPPLPKGYQPITGSIYNLMNTNHVSWIDYFSDTGLSRLFVQPINPKGPNRKDINGFLSDAQHGKLPQVAFIDASISPDQTINGAHFETDEHPPNDIRAGEFFASQIVQALRASPNWADSVLFITYDEHGGFYDHVAPPPALQGPTNPLNPDGIDPANCEDLSSPPRSKLPGGGANCTQSPKDAVAICPKFIQGKPYPHNCANFNQYGFRVPFIAVSPFSKQGYVSHTLGDHTSILRFIEERFLNGQSMTLRDKNANDLTDMFDFDHSPSASSAIGAAPAPKPRDAGCPFGTAPAD